ncbi:MAG TPA: hypothetical protein DCG24_02875 [Bacteroidetes bacterium]|nr:hypothetical protein [Bacteroidota bacterium]HAE35279.1 hypothetical protein [Bacteroidota bacterium]
MKFIRPFEAMQLAKTYLTSPRFIRWEIVGDVRLYTGGVSTIDVLVVPDYGMRVHENLPGVASTIRPAGPNRFVCEVPLTHINCDGTIPGRIYLTSMRDLGRQQILRTGTPEFAEWIRSRWRSLGFVDTPYGLCLKAEAVKGKGRTYMPKSDIKICNFPTEESVFSMLGLRFVHPVNRINKQWLSNPIRPNSYSRP